MDNLTKYALDGLRITNQELFNKRAYEIINRYNALNLMTDGVPVSVEVIDAAKLNSYIQNKFKNCLELTVKEVIIDDNFDIEVKYNYIYIRYYNNKKDAENKAWSNFKERKDEEYNIPVEIITSGYCTISKNDVEIAGLKLNIL